MWICCLPSGCWFIGAMQVEWMEKPTFQPIIGSIVDNKFRVCKWHNWLNVNRSLLCIIHRSIRAVQRLTNETTLKKLTTTNAIPSRLCNALSNKNSKVKGKKSVSSKWMEKMKSNGSFRFRTMLIISSLHATFLIQTNCVSSQFLWELCELCVILYTMIKKPFLTMACASQCVCLYSYIEFKHNKVITQTNKSGYGTKPKSQFS